MDLKETYNKIAKSWSETRPNEWMQQSIDKFISFLKPGDSILDVGCASGDKSKYFYDKGMNVVGIDFSEKMIEIARKALPEGDFKVLDVKKIGELGEQFDGVFARAVLLHFKKQEIPKILSLLKDTLKDGGYLYIAVKEKRENEKEEELVKENDYGSEIERFFSYFTMNEIEDYFERLGMEICFKTISVVKTGTRKWIQVIARK
jgi:cyclopropane fatty-acyl-phospholipid synthase-like methyltransferase